MTLQEALKDVYNHYSQAVHRPVSEEDGPPVKMLSPTRKKQRGSSPAADTAVAVAGDMAAEAVIQAAAAASTPAEAVAAAEHAAEVVMEAAAEAVGGHASTSPAAVSAKSAHAETLKVSFCRVRSFL